MGKHHSHFFGDNTNCSFQYDCLSQDDTECKHIHRWVSLNLNNPVVFRCSFFQLFVLDSNLHLMGEFIGMVTMVTLRPKLPLVFLVKGRRSLHHCKREWKIYAIVALKPEACYMNGGNIRSLFGC